MRPPLAIFMCARSATSGCCPASNPARSPESSDLRCHSSSAAITARAPSAPNGIARNVDDSASITPSSVRYTACPLSTCPNSWPSTNRRLVVVHHVDQARVEHDDRLVEPDGHRVDGGVGPHEQFGQSAGVQGVTGLAVEPVHAGELPLVGAHRRTQHQHAHGPFVEKARLA